MSGEINLKFDSMEGKFENQKGLKGEWSGKHLTKSKLKSTTPGELSSADEKTPLKWKFETGNPRCPSPVVSDGVVYFGSGYHLYAVDIK